MHANNHNASGLDLSWKANQALPLHLIQTYVDQFPRESLLKSCSGVDNGVRGLSACSVISTIFYISYLKRLPHRFQLAPLRNM